MENKQPLKINLITAILIIIILVLCSAFLVYNCNEKIKHLEEELESVKSMYSAELDKTDEENKEQVIPSIFTATEKIKTEKMEYSFSDITDENSSLINIKIKDGKAYIEANNNADDSIENLASYLEIDKNKIKINTNEYTEITGFSKKVINAHIGAIGQDVSATIFVFLMEDGTVEYSTLSHMLTNLSIEGTIDNLNNIVSLHTCSVNDAIEGGGYASIVALDSENYFYNLNDYL